MTEVRTIPAAALHRGELAALFERANVACYCRYWHFDGVTNAWLNRVAHHPEENRAELEAALLAGSEEARGVVALRGERVVGWVKVAPVTAVRKLYDQRLYRKLPCFDGPREGVHAIGCFLVDPAERGRGVARALLDGAVALATERGATSLEAFPRRDERTSDEAAWTGPYTLFAAAGFEVVHDFGPYPVMRRSLAPRGSGQ